MQLGFFVCQDGTLAAGTELLHGSVYTSRYSKRHVFTGGNVLQVEMERVRAMGRHRRRNEVPWASLAMFLVCGAFLGAGMWLLFGTNGIQGGSK